MLQAMLQLDKFYQTVFEHYRRIQRAEAACNADSVTDIVDVSSLEKDYYFQLSELQNYLKQQFGEK
jgi:hypothetical protein